MKRFFLLFFQKMIPPSIIDLLEAFILGGVIFSLYFGFIVFLNSENLLLPRLPNWREWGQFLF
ncbi:MAG: hypothetical protein RL757_343 [Bacteroidota bacterium]|jgi:hypothetical protein